MGHTNEIREFLTASGGKGFQSCPQMLYALYMVPPRRTRGSANGPWSNRQQAGPIPYVYMVHCCPFCFLSSKQRFRQRQPNGFQRWAMAALSPPEMQA